MQKTSQCEVIGRHPNNFAEQNRHCNAVLEPHYQKSATASPACRATAEAQTRDDIRDKMIPIAQEDTLNAMYYGRSNNLRVQPGAEANVRATNESGSTL